MKILIAGDFCPQNRVADCFRNQHYDKVLCEVKAITERADLSIVNFECVVSNGDESPIKKCGSLLRCNGSGVEALKWAGFDCVTLANNHIRDFGDIGVKNTIDEFRNIGIDNVGGGLNMNEASQILYREVNGKQLAIINCCEHEFSIATEESAGANPLNPVKQYYAIKEAKKKSDYVLVIVHGGHEHYQLPSPRMQETYRFFVDAGADAVINHHQHCFSGYEIYNGAPIFYGLGNFCFDKGKPRNKQWHEGIMVMLDLKEGENRFEIIPYNQCEYQPSVVVRRDDAELLTRVAELNAIIADINKLHECYVEYCDQSLREVNLLLEPISNRYIRALQQRNFLPMYHFGKKQILRLYNIIFCEAHRDKVFAFLKKEYKRCE